MGENVQPVRMYEKRTINDDDDDDVRHEQMQQFPKNELIIAQMNAV